MRCVSLMLLMILILYLPISAYAGCSGGVNPLYDESVMPDSDFFVSTMQQKANPASGPNMNMPSPNPKPLVTPGNNSSQANSSTTTNQSSAGVQTQPVVRLLDVSGKWSVRFNESSNRTLDLILFQSTSPDRIMGSGTLVEESSKIPLIASGSVTEKELSLTAKTVISEYGNKIDRQFDLKLLIMNNTLSGTYLIKSSGKVLGKGNATAARS